MTLMYPVKGEHGPAPFGGGSFGQPYHRGAGLPFDRVRPQAMQIATRRIVGGLAQSPATHEMTGDHRYITLPSGADPDVGLVTRIGEAALPMLRDGGP